MFETYQKGIIAELKVQLRAAEKGFIVSRPTTEARYDLIIDTGDERLRVQVKYADAKIGQAIHLDLRKQTRNRGPRKTYTADEVDLILVYLPTLDLVSALKPEMFQGKGSISLRLAPPKRKQNRRVLMAKELVW